MDVFLLLTQWNLFIILEISLGWYVSSYNLSELKKRIKLKTSPLKTKISPKNDKNPPKKYKIAPTFFAPKNTNPPPPPQKKKTKMGPRFFP
jgi:hypothetical protein